ncbi:hypothetical protein DL239_19830 [Sedimentitalea sp. CY04]|uniref:LysM domain-containing protein n=1 Tax=Parasedimentitalea denitrificans TaxID=2211118 RepID=A0ABX0WBZ9_9RHOB|nr:hypothetical protein [Sedimentitalea sp. CY04]NIZ63220.1 hypothetical protein [Sedimentitalea sp. CY04]
MSDVLEKQMKNEESSVSKEISKVVTAALNSKDTISKADDINGGCGGWPYAPTKEMLKMYGKVSEAAWKKLKPGYKNFDVTINVNSPSNKPPFAKAEAIFDGEWKGGKSMMVSPGDTILSMAKKVYGYESYADQVFEENTKALGKSCRILPAGFGLSFPKIWVPNWKKDPKVCVHPIVKKKAVKVKLPSAQVSADISKKSAATLVFPGVIVVVDLEGKAEFTAQKKGELDASFSLKANEAEIKKALGPLEAGYKITGSGTSSGSLSLKVINTKLGGLNVSGNLKLLEGAFELEFASQTVSFVEKDITYSGTVKLTAKIQIKPNPRKKAPKKAPKRAPAKAPARSPSVSIDAKDVAVGVIVVGAVVTVGWAVGLAAAGGALIFAAS